MNQPDIPHQVGPYRIEDALGEGGMGAVYRAWDQRLRRRVALKLLHPQQTPQQDAILHEARMIATLNHPHVMQIYDIVEEGEFTVLVLEWVEGINLLQLQGQRPLPVLQVYHYARQILGGLAAAHRLGVVHGDLKSENIMVNSEGQIKILDFGLAHRRHESRHSAPGAGTGRCISPEQLTQTGDFDSRADLFSFGVLMYEMLSGHSPFLRDTLEATLTAIRDDTPPRLDQLDPNIPTALADLVQQLLYKDPAQRPANAELALLELEALREGITRRAYSVQGLSHEQLTLNTAVTHTLPATMAGNGNNPMSMASVPPAGTSLAAARGTDSPAGSDPRHHYSRVWYQWVGAMLIILVVSLLVFSWQHQQTSTANDSPRYVAIAPPVINGIANSEQVATLSAALNLAARKELENHVGLVVVPGDTINELADNSAELGSVTGADEVIHTSLVCAGNECNAHVERLDQQQERLWSRSFTTPPEAPLLYRALRVHLKETYASLPQRRQDTSTVDATDLDRLLWLQGEFERNEMQHLNSEQMLERIDDLLVSSPAFDEAHLLRSRILLYRYHQQADSADLQQARDALDNVGVTPGSSMALFEIALAQNDLDSAEQALEQYATQQPGSATILAMRSRLAERRGETQRALVLMREAAQRQPSWRHWFWAAEMAYRHGDAERAREDLEALLALVPEHYAGLSLLAEIEMQDGHLNTAESIYRRLVLRSPQLAELSNLGTVYLFLGQYAQAVESFQRALELAPENPYVRLNLADAHKLNNNHQAAAEQYDWLANNIDHATQDPDLLAVLTQAQAHLGHNDTARSNIQRLLDHAQHQPQALYTAAIVFTLLNLDNDAQHYRQLAQEQGIDEIWFNLPWFEPSAQ